MKNFEKLSDLKLTDDQLSKLKGGAINDILTSHYIQSNKNKASECSCDADGGNKNKANGCECK